MTTPESAENRDIRDVLGRLLDPAGISADQQALCDVSADAAARMQAFMLDHMHNEERLAQVLDELATPRSRDAA